MACSKSLIASNAYGLWTRAIVFHMNIIGYRRDIRESFKQTFIDKRLGCLIFHLI